MKTLHISAGGKGKRIASYISTISPFLPKHLLPIPTEGKTILGEIVHKAQVYFEDIKIWSSKETYPRIVLTLENEYVVNVQVDSQMSGPLGPVVRNLILSEERAFACAGDFYCDFQWSDFESFHDSHDLPISILVARSLPAPKGARFCIAKNRVKSWQRVEKTTIQDYINIGCYIIDPVPEVISEIKKLSKHKEDVFFDTFISMNLVAAFNPGVLGYNVNLAEVYESLLNSLAEDVNH